MASILHPFLRVQDPAHAPALDWLLALVGALLAALLRARLPG